MEKYLANVPTVRPHTYARAHDYSVATTFTTLVGLPALIYTSFLVLNNQLGSYH